MNGRCCVFQPFDKGPYDKRYEDTVAPAIKAAGLEPYRVDRDDGAVIPIETLHEEIRTATLCLADITTRNPNVMYELGYAIASTKDVILISANQTIAFPFDIQHRGIIQYSLDSASDFEQLKKTITNRLKALLKKQVATQKIVSASPVKSTEGLQPNEISALALVMASVDSPESMVSAYIVKQAMERAGYTNLAANLALARLSKMRLVEAGEDTDYNGQPFVAYKILEEGQNWLFDNQEKLELRIKPQAPLDDNDIPF